jgi:hypothetical protein
MLADSSHVRERFEAANRVNPIDPVRVSEPAGRRPRRGKYQLVPPNRRFAPLAGVSVVRLLRYGKSSLRAVIVARLVVVIALAVVIATTIVVKRATDVSVVVVGASVIIGVVVVRVAIPARIVRVGVCVITGVTVSVIARVIVAAIAAIIVHAVPEKKREGQRNAPTDLGLGV